MGAFFCPVFRPAFARLARAGRIVLHCYHDKLDSGVAGTPQVLRIERAFGREQDLDKRRPAKMVATVERVGIRYIPLTEPMWVGGPQDQLVTSLSVSRAHGGTVFRVTPDQWNAIVSASEQSAADADIEQIRKRIDLSPTEREGLAQAGRGQGRFRQDLLKYWRGCAVVGSTIQSILRASHIKPWRESADGERLDPANGLLLTANLDALFNDGLISFNDHGGMLISLRLRRSDRSLLQLGGKLRKGPVARQIGYLTYHRERVFGR